MNTYSTLTALFTAIANAIRAKTGGSASIKADDFPTAVGGIVTLSEGTEDANATAGDILASKTCYVKGAKVTGNIAAKTSSNLSVSGATVTAPAGYYASNASKTVASGSEGTPTASKGAVSNHAISVTPSVTNSAGYISGGTKTGTAVSVAASELVSGTKTISASGTTDVTIYKNASVAEGSATTPATSITANPTVSIDADGLVTASVSKTQSVTPTVSAGYVASGTAGNVSVSGSGTLQLTKRTSASLSASGATVTAPAGYYPEAASKSVASGTEGTPTATKGTVSNHAISVTPSVTNTAGYIAGGTKTGTAVSVSASELVSGTKSITASGTVDVTNYQKASVAAGTATTPATTVTANPTVTKSGGNIVASYSGSKSVTPTVSAGYVASGTAGTVSTSGSTTVAATSLEANLVDTNIKKDVTIFGVTGSYEGSGGGGGVAENDVNFIDYDGTIVASYSAADFANLSALPANPSHNGLTAQGWNWSLSDAKTYVASYEKLWIGQMYITSDGKTRIYIRLEEGRLAPYLGIAINGSAAVDWGDGTSRTVTGSSTSTIVNTQHTYSAAGDYVITISVSGSMALIGSSSYRSQLLWKNSMTENQNRCYQNTIQKIEIGSNTSIDSYAFYNCYSLASVTIPSSVTSIGSNAFGNCYSLARFTIPLNVTSIESLTFGACHGLASIAIPSNVTSIKSSAFISCYSLASITIPPNVTSIGSSAFSSCYSLASITIPPNVTSIESSAFSSCYGLASITIPPNVTSIGSKAFYYCYSLGAIHFKSTTPPAVENSNAWTSVPTDCIIYVPRGYKTAYTGATNYPSSSTYTYVEYDP